MSAHEAPGVPEPDQPPTPDHAEELAEIERLKVEVGDRVRMLRERRRGGVVGRLQALIGRVRG